MGLWDIVIFELGNKSWKVGQQLWVFGRFGQGIKSWDRTPPPPPLLPPPPFFISFVTDLQYTDQPKSSQYGPLVDKSAGRGHKTSNHSSFSVGTHHFFFGLLGPIHGHLSNVVERFAPFDLVTLTCDFVPVNSPQKTNLTRHTRSNNY